MAALGVTVLAVGIGGLLTDPAPSDEPWTGLMATGLTVSLVGFGGATIATQRTNHLTHDFHHLDPTVVRTEIDAYNEQLRSDLGLGGGFGAPAQEPESQR